MKAAVLNEKNAPVVIEEISVDGPSKGEVLVKIAATGVCHSCYHAVTGTLQVPLPTILGDEGAGVVEEVGPGVNQIKPGDHVILSWVPACRKCTYCNQGYPSVCLKANQIEKGYMSDGTTRYSRNGEPVYHFAHVSSFAEYTVVAQESAIRIDKDIPLDKAALIGCSVTTGVCAVTNTARVRPGSSVAVFGIGGIGLNVIQGAVLAGAEKVIAVDLSDEKLLMANQFGATHMINSRRSDAVLGICELTEGLGADYAFEAVGTKKTYEQAARSVRSRGTVVWIGAPPVEPLSLDAGVVFWGEKTIMGSNYGSVRPWQDMPRLIELYKTGRLKIDELVTRGYRLEQINDAFEDMLGGEVGRGVIYFDTK